MTDRHNDSGAAFPLGTVDGYCTDGMSLRDYFAAAALPSVISEHPMLSPSVHAATAYGIADAMLKARALASRDDGRGE